MNINQITEFSTILDYLPVIFRGNPLNLLFLEDAQRIRTPHNFMQQLCSNKLIDERREYFLGSDLQHTYIPFPVVSIENRPNPKELSEELFYQFPRVNDLVLSQEDIAETITNMAYQNNPEVIILMLIDGLSYYDLPDSPDTFPCFVNGPTITEFGFPQIISKPSISNRLFFQGYKNQHAFSYFGLSNPLSACLHEGFSEASFTRIRTYKDVLESIRKQIMPKSYFQIILDGLDSMCHKHRDEPQIDQMIRKIVDRFNELENVLSKLGFTYQIHLISDHGILWYKDFDEFLVAEDNFSEDRHHPRYIKGAYRREYGQLSKGINGKVTLFKAPYINRKFRNNEWGVHGGISAWESIVPFLTRVG